jgi:uncharacterized protein YkwD
LGRRVELWHIAAVVSFSRFFALFTAASLSILASSACRPAEAPLRKTGPATLQEAQQYVLALVNQDREEAGLEPVAWDEHAAQAAQVHAQDMARNGFTGHWGTDGSIPEQRYSQAGGMDFMQENAACFFDGVTRELDPQPVFERGALSKIETAFISEVPPNDGHRKNILTPTHNLLGVGLAKPRGVDQPCLAQEFVSRYGSYGPLPTEATVGETIHVAGEVGAPVEFGAVGLARVEPQQPVSVQQLLQRSTYPVPEPYVLYFPAGYKTPKPVQVEGGRFNIDVKLDDRGRPGRYEVSIWGRHPGQQELFMVSLRTILVR